VRHLGPLNEANYSYEKVLRWDLCGLMKDIPKECRYLLYYTFDAFICGIKQGNTKT
jgi:hypothetical protein